MKHPRALAAEGITPERYSELRAVCHQYRTYVHKLKQARAGLEDRPRRSSGAWRKPAPTGNAAAAIADKYAWIAARAHLIEQCAQLAGGAAAAPSLLESVTEERGYDALRHRPPCGRRQFYVARLGFYILLDSGLRGNL